MNSPIDLFFKMGDKATGGDPMRQQDFTYYMLWILFLAFFSMFILNMYQFITYRNGDDLVWAVIGFAIMSLQYFNLKQLYEVRKIRHNKPKELPIESPKEMLDYFTEKGGEENVRKSEKEKK